jgi:hypothetical protein
MYGHSPEAGHKCPSCGVGMICTIEDGYCAVGGSESNLCDKCLRQMHYDSAMRGEDWMYRD